MTDIDFDELDRAVNSIMSGGVRPSAPSLPAEPSNQSDASASRPASDSQLGSSTASGVVNTPEVRPYDDSMRSTAAPAAERSAQSVAIPSRRGGRFMDVVHPSSDMKTSTGATARQVSRNAATIEPIESTVAATDIDELNALLTESNDATQPDTSTTPFLTDTKVEKRPLGGARSETSVSDEEDHVSEPTARDSEVTEVTVQNITPKRDTSVKPQEDEFPKAPMPAELTPDLLSIESGDSENETATPTPVAVTNITPRPEVKVQQKTSDDVEQPMRPIASVRPEEPRNEIENTTTPTDNIKRTASVGPIAIEQQYSPQPSTSPAESGSIYDTDSYHQPLAHPEKKKSGWMWVVWVFLLLILGAGGGAIAYFLLIQ